MKLRDLVFDLDGTLVDSRPGIDRAGARASVRAGREPVALAPFIGPPVRVMFARAYPDAPAHQLDALVEHFRRAYDTTDWRLTRPMPGLDTVLHAVRAHGGRAFVVTNKPHVATQRILHELDLHARLTAVLSPDGPEAPFTAKAIALAYLRRSYALSGDDTAYVGDADEDRLAAQLTGLPFVAAAYGYGDAGATLVESDLARIDHLSDLLNLIG